MKFSKMKLCAYGLTGVLLAMGVFISADVAFAGMVTARAENNDDDLLKKIEEEIEDGNPDDNPDNGEPEDSDNGEPESNPDNGEPENNPDNGEPEGDLDNGEPVDPDNTDPVDNPDNTEPVDPETGETGNNGDSQGNTETQPETPEHVHQYNYTDNGDGTHTRWCADTECGLSEMMDHVYGEEDHLCDCGAMDPEYEDQNNTDGTDETNPDTPNEVPADTENSFEFSEDQYNSMNNEIDTLNKEISNLTNQLNNYKNTASKTTSSSGSNNSSAVSSLNSKVSSLQSQNASMQNNVSSLSSANATLQSKNNTLTSEIASLKSQITALNNQLNALKKSSATTTPAQPVVKSTAANTSSASTGQNSNEGFQESKSASVTNIQNLVETTIDATETASEDEMETFNMSLNNLSDDIYFDFSESDDVPEELVSTSQSTSAAKYQSGAETSGLAKNTLSKKRMKDNQTVMVAGCVSVFSILMFVALMIFGFKSGILNLKKNKPLVLEEDASEKQNDIEHSTTTEAETPVNAEPAGSAI